MYTPLEETLSPYKITDNVTNYISIIIQIIDIINIININSGNYERNKSYKRKNTKTKDDQIAFPHKIANAV
jgi:purine-cytosine permease-like protein